MKSSDCQFDGFSNGAAHRQRDTVPHDPVLFRCGKRTIAQKIGGKPLQLTELREFTALAIDALLLSVVSAIGYSACLSFRGKATRFNLLMLKYGYFRLQWDSGPGPELPNSQAALLLAKPSHIEWQSVNDIALYFDVRNLWNILHKEPSGFAFGYTSSEFRNQTLSDLVSNFAVNPCVPRVCLTRWPSDHSIEHARGRVK